MLAPAVLRALRMWQEELHRHELLGLMSCSKRSTCAACSDLPYVTAMGRDLVATHRGTKITMMPGATFTPNVQTGGVAHIQGLLLNRASTRAYATAAVPATNQAVVVAFNIESGSLQLLNSVRWL